MIADTAFTQQAQHRGQLTVYLNLLESEEPRPRKTPTSFPLRTSVDVLVPRFRISDNPGCPTSRL
jgi:hypothetical protein